MISSQSRNKAILIFLVVLLRIVHLTTRIIGIRLKGPMNLLLQKSIIKCFHRRAGKNNCKNMIIAVDLILTLRG